MSSKAFTNINPKTRKKSYFKADSEHLDLLDKHGLVVIDRDTFLVRDELVSHLGDKDDIICTVTDLGYSVCHYNHKESFLARLRRNFLPRKYFTLAPEKKSSMIGAGIAHRGKRFTTHSTLQHHHTAITTFSSWQIGFALLVTAAAILGIWANPLTAGVIIVAILSAIYFIDVVFSLYLVLKSLHFPPELNFSDEQLAKPDNKDLPVYTILCPLYREAHVLPHFVESIEKLDWPKEKLDVQLLLEQDDAPTIEAAKSLQLPKYMRVIVVPDSKPKTKPKACNYGLAHAKGEFVVVYDAEDRPDPFQLKKAYLAFKQSSEKIACVQAKLNYYNPHQNLLTRFFTAEYSLWFDVVLPGLQSINTTIPLGGTSNHFRTEVLKKLEGWDAFNVTEDCDLGSRIFKKGFTTVLIDSVTLEEANSHLGNWIRQRSRWIKGYLQTYLVHTRNFPEFIRTHGIHAVVFQLVIGLRMTFMIINPLLWLLTISYFTLYSFVGPTIEAFYPAAVFYMAVISLVFGNFLYLYYYMIGCAKRGAWSLIKWVLLVPVYWLFISVASWKAFYQLLTKPHYWEKTNHGLHIKNQVIRSSLFQDIGWVKGLSDKKVITGGVLVAATVISNLFGFLYNAYLGRAKNVSIEEFGLISLIGSILYITQIPFTALSKTITYKSAYLLGKYNINAKRFWLFVRSKALILSIFLTVIWLLALPVLTKFFQTENASPFILFSPIWIIGALTAIDRGFLGGSQKFILLAIITLLEAISKLVATVFFVETGLSELVYIAIPLSMVASYVIGWFAANALPTPVSTENAKSETIFPKRFFATSILVKLSNLAFLSLDIILAKVFLSATQAGEYALLSLVGKIVYLIGSLFSQFITPVVSHSEGAGTNSKKTFYKLLTVTTLASMGGFIVFGMFAPYTVPILFGEKTASILRLLPIYTLSVVAFSIASNIVNYHQIKRQYLFPLLGFLVTLVQTALLYLFHEDLSMFVAVMAILSVFQALLISFTHIFYPHIVSVFHNALDFFDLFKNLKKPLKTINQGKMNILIFNWRDTKHVWAGGAEIYIQQLARYWVQSGHNVTIFCGNDGHSSRNETINDVRIIRRGGTFTVYLWAFIYYVLKLRGAFDMVIDSENGIPFFTPLYVRVPKFLLIHHIHQDKIIFQGRLPFPLVYLAMFLESKLMPIVYSNSKIITVSESSKQDIVKLGISKAEDIEIVSPGIELSQFSVSKKTPYPSIIYLGRIRPYKNLDIALSAFASVLKKFPNAIFTIAGWGDNVEALRRQTQNLGISESVKFLGKVKESDKPRLLSKNWIAVQPSSFEGWGITVIEANASGTPVIASDVVGLRDSVLSDQTGVLVPVSDVASLSQAIIRLFDNERLRIKLSKNAIQWANKFKWSNLSTKFIDTVKQSLVTHYKYNLI